MPTLLENATILTPFEEIKDGIVLINDEGFIAEVGKSANIIKSEADRIDAGGKFIVPGFIDMHVHGGNRVTFGLGDLAEGLDRYAHWVSSFGETGFLMSITGPDVDSIESIIQSYTALLPLEYSGAQPLGLHLEGPFLNLEKHGAFNPHWLHDPDITEIKRYLKAAHGWVKQVTLAPELPQAYAVAELLSESGIIAALGHSNTDYEGAADALSKHFSHVTHTYNAQSPLHHRRPGVVGAVLASENATAELIADGRHIHPAAMKILVRCLGSERIVLITDAMAGAGMPDGEYEIVGQKVIVKNKQATLPDGTIGGSTTTINQCVRNMVKLVDVSMKDAVRMASLNPAKVLGIDGQTGCIKTGMLANLAVIDQDINVFKTFVKGKLVYSKEQG